MDARLLRTHELARELAISERTVRKLVADGMPRIEVTPKLHRYDLAVVRNWLESRTRTVVVKGIQ